MSNKYEVVLLPDKRSSYPQVLSSIIHDASNTIIVTTDDEVCNHYAKSKIMLRSVYSDNAIYDEINNNSINQVVLFDCFGDPCNALLLTLHNMMSTNMFKLVLVYKYSNAKYLHRRLLMNLASTIYVPNSFKKQPKNRMVPWENDGYFTNSTLQILSDYNDVADN